MQSVIFFNIFIFLKERRLRMVRKPYIGVTGFMSQQEVHFLREHVPPEPWGGYDLMAGILVGSKTLRGEPNRHPGRFPKIEQVRHILYQDPHVLWLIHFHTEKPEALQWELCEVIERAGECCNGIQLNVVWPDPQVVENYWQFLSARSQNPRIVLQVGGRALRQTGNDPQEVARRVCTYWETGSITDVLIDPSGGLGLAFDPSVATAYLSVLKEQCPGLGLGIAGGLSASSLHLIEPLIPCFPRLNIDAEGRLRNATDDSLNLAETIAYVSSALRMLQGT